MGTLLMSRLSAAASVKLTAKHLTSVTIEDSTFQVLPWPGIFLYNATTVLLTRCPPPSTSSSGTGSSTPRRAPSPSRRASRWRSRTTC